MWPIVNAPRGSILETLAQELDEQVERDKRGVSRPTAQPIKGSLLLNRDRFAWKTGNVEVVMQTREGCDCESNSHVFTLVRNLRVRFSQWGVQLNTWNAQNFDDLVFWAYIYNQVPLSPQKSPFRLHARVGIVPKSKLFFPLVLLGLGDKMATLMRGSKFSTTTEPPSTLRGTRTHL